MKKFVNTTATADIGYVEKLPYRRPPQEVESQVVAHVRAIVEALRIDTGADVRALRAEIDDLIFDLFEITASRDEIRRFYETVGRVERDDQAASE
jgi:hypothetical protein